jgi:hypothetical protein
VFSVRSVVNHPGHGVVNPFDCPTVVLQKAAEEAEEGFEEGLLCVFVPSWFKDFTSAPPSHPCHPSDP